MGMVRVCAIVAIVGSMLFLRCLDPVTTGTSDETVVSSAKIFLPDATPAKNAKVAFFRVDDTTHVAQQTVYTDASGSYSLATVTDGTYNVMARLDSLVCYQDSIPISKGKAVVSDDTLEPGCTFEGMVRLQPGHDPRNAIVHVLGSYFYTNVDNSGRFVLPRVPSGAYRFMISVANLSGYVTTYVPVKITCSDPASLRDTFSVVYTGIPTVVGLSLAYDTSRAVVRLSWKANSFPEFREYIIHRFPMAQVSPLPDTSWVTTDTFIADTLRFSTVPVKKIDSVYGYDTSLHSFEVKRYEYRVSIRNKALLVGSTYESATIIAEHPLAAVHPFRRYGLAAKVDQPCTLKAYPSLYYGATASYDWDIGGTGAFKNSLGPTFVFTVPDTFALSIPCILRVSTSNGKTFFDTIHVRPVHYWEYLGTTGIQPHIMKNLMAVELNGAMYLFDDDPLSLWKSDDGTSWKKIASTLPFEPKDVVVFNDELWAITDTISLWHSNNGVLWHEIKWGTFVQKTPGLADSLRPITLSGRKKLVVFKNKLYIRGNSRFFQVQPDSSLVIFPTPNLFGTSYSGTFIQWVVATSERVLFRTTYTGAVFMNQIITTTDMASFDVIEYSTGDDSTVTANEFTMISNTVAHRNMILGFNSMNFANEVASWLGKGYALIGGPTQWMNISEKPERSGTLPFPECLVVHNGSLYSIGAAVHRFH